MYYSKLYDSSYKIAEYNRKQANDNTKTRVSYNRDTYARNSLSSKGFEYGLSDW